MPNVLRAARGGNKESETTTGPSSYPSGGWSHRSDLGRVDRVIAKTGDDDGGAKSFDTVVSVESDNTLRVGLYSQASGTEVASGTDVSDITVTYEATRL